jgi:hypothetical protein
MERRGSGGATVSGPHPPGTSTRSDQRSVAPRTPRGVAEPGRAVAPVCENRLDGSAACPPITRGLSPPGYNLVLRGCRHPRAIFFSGRKGDSERRPRTRSAGKIGGTAAVNPVEPPSLALGRRFGGGEGMGLVSKAFSGTDGAAEPGGEGGAGFGGDAGLGELVDGHLPHAQLPRAPAPRVDAHLSGRP